MRIPTKTRSVLLAILLFIAAASPGGANVTPQDVQQGIDKTRTEIAEYEKVIKALEADIKTREARLTELENELERAEKLLEQMEKELAESESRLAEKSRAFGGRLRSAYMKGGMSYLEMLLDAESIGDLIIRAGYLKRMLSNDAEIITAFRDEQETLAQRAAALAEERQNAANMRYEMDAQLQNLVAQRREQDALLKRAREKLADDLAGITPQAQRKPVYAVVIDNASPARPQHGLSQADIIYEYEVEGRITRYLALFSTLPNKVGPVRSAREHSIMLSMENKAHYIYSSAGVDVLAKIDNWKVDGTNALYARTSSIFRDNSRRAPHNLYVNLATLGAAAPSRDVVIRPAYLSREGAAGTSFSLQYSNNLRIQYEYDQKQRAYRRHVNGQVHRDAGGKTIMARNVIIQYVPHKTDLAGRPTPDIIGSGTIDYYALGRHFRGTWRKDSIDSPTRFYYEDGQEIERVYGQTWVQLARPR